MVVLVLSWVFIWCPCIFFLFMTTGEKNLEGLQPMVKPMWLPLHWASEQAGFMGCPHYQWLLSHKLLSLSDNLFSCLIVFSFLFLFLIFFYFLCNIEQIPLVETKYLIPARYIPANTSLLIPDEKLESRTRRVLSNTYQKLIQSVFLDDSIPNGVKYLMWVWHQLPSDLTWMSFLRWW